MNIVIDIIFVIFILAVFGLSYRRGFLTKAWWLIDLALIIAFGIFLSPTILDALRGTALYNALYDSLASAVDFIDIENVATMTNVIFTVGIWILLAIAVIIVMAIVKALLRRLTQYKFFKVIDGILGGVYSAALTVAILVLLGALLSTFNVFAPIANAEEFCSGTYVFKYVFGENLFRSQMEKYFNLGSWIYNLIN